MPTKRTVLAELTLRELRAGLDFYGLQVSDRRVKAQLVDALARSRKAHVEEVLQALSRDRLKALCRAFGLDDSGRKKAHLVVRLAGPTPAPLTGKPPTATAPTVALRSDGGDALPSAPRSRVKTPDPSADMAGVAGPATPPKRAAAPPAASRPSTKTPDPSADVPHPSADMASVARPTTPPKRAAAPPAALRPGTKTPDPPADVPHPPADPPHPSANLPPPPADVLSVAQLE